MCNTLLEFSIALFMPNFKNLTKKLKNRTDRAICSTEVERRSLAGELSLSGAQPVADR